MDKIVPDENEQLRKSINNQRLKLQDLVKKYIEDNCVDFKKTTEKEYFILKIGNFFDNLIAKCYPDQHFILNETPFSGVSSTGDKSAVSTTSNLTNSAVSAISDTFNIQ